MRTARLTPFQALMAEIGADGPKCGHECAAHSQGRTRADGAAHALVCGRLAHHGADVMVDMHAGLDENGLLVTFAEVCDGDPAG